MKLEELNTLAENQRSVQIFIVCTFASFSKANGITVWLHINTKGSHVQTNH